jgi:Rad3-related DNA helicase
MDQATCICLALGILTLTLVYRTVALRTLNELPTEVTPNGETVQPVETVAQPETAEPVAPEPGLAPALPAQDQEERIKAQLEAQHRDEWCRRYEEAEVARHFREKFCQHEFNRQYDEARRLEETKTRLHDLMVRRKGLEESLHLYDFVQSGAFSGLSF